MRQDNLIFYLEAIKSGNLVHIANEFCIIFIIITDAMIVKLYSLSNNNI